MFSLSLQDGLSQPLEMQEYCYAQLPKKVQISKIARLYARAFAGFPWNEYKVCENSHYYGGQFFELECCTNCGQPLKLVYPEEYTSAYIIQEVGKPQGTLITFEDKSGEVFAAGWGYACLFEELLDKYSSLEMKAKVQNSLEKVAHKVQTVFYLSEIMVDEAVQKKGITTKITKALLEKARSLNLIFVMRTHGDSPMVRIANKLEMSQVVSLEEDLDNPKRVLYIKYQN